MCVVPQASLDSFRKNNRQQQADRPWYLGRIVMIETFTASAALNPYSLPHGSQFHVLHSETITVRNRGLLTPHSLTAGASSSSSSSGVRVTTTTPVKQQAASGAASATGPFSGEKK